MRTTIDIPDELLRAAKVKAAQEGRTLRAIVLEGLFLALQKPPAERRELRKVRFPLIEGNQDGRIVTNEMVQKAIDDFLEEDARYHAQFVRR